MTGDSDVSAIAVSVIVCAIVFGGALFGASLRNLLPRLLMPLPPLRDISSAAKISNDRLERTTPRERQDDTIQRPTVSRLSHHLRMARAVWRQADHSLSLWA